ncbi:MAG: hypothetical protein PHV17_10265, partial [Candidatus Omnitrophica bacterium]|nr:hypothetical protein [Candidatus Omnitrophota bacterium]
MNNKKNIKIIYLFMLVFVTAFFVYGENVASTISSMLESGFDTSKAMKLYGKWADSKSLVIALAKSGDPDKIELAHKIVEHRYNAFEECWRDAVAGAAKKTAKPVEAMVPTGGWKKPLAYKSSDPVNFIIDGANADIDATIFARTEVVEDVTSDILVSWAERTRGDIVSASGEIDYVEVNQVLRDSEVTVFPRHPNGYMSDDFKRKFPEVVHESYPGSSGQRSLEVTYMLNKQKAKADIVRYDAKGEMILEDGKAAILRDQPAENVIEDLSQAKYNRLSRISKLDADFELKFKGHIQGLNKSQQDELTAKMLGRMMDEEAAVRGYPVKDNLLYVKAAKVKDAIRQNDDAALKKALKGQDLDDFVRQARQEINRIGIENKRRLVEMMDDSLMRSGKSLDLDALVEPRRGTSKVLKALTLLGYGYDVADAYLRAEKGKETRAVIKGLAVALAADAAGSTVGAAVGASLGQGLLAGAGGVASGIGSGIVAGIVVGASVDYTAEMVDDLVGGYKADGVVKGMFLNPDNIENFIKMDQ